MSIDGGLRKIFRTSLPMYHWQSIETPLTGSGVPDCNACYNGVEFWVECKKTDHWHVRMQTEQPAWIERRMRAGGRVFVAVRRATDELWLFNGSAARPLLTERLDNAPALLGMWRGGAKRWDWHAVGAILRGSKDR